MTCCFTGHRILPRGKEKQIFEKTKEVVIELIGKGVKYFGTGGAIGYDTLAAHAVLSLKEKYPFIKLIVVCPCKNQKVIKTIKANIAYVIILKISAELAVPLNMQLFKTK